MAMNELKKAWADHIGCDYDDDRVIYADKCGWPKDFRNFSAGWEAARKAAILAWEMVLDGSQGEHAQFIKRVVFNLDIE